MLDDRSEQEEQVGVLAELFVQELWKECNDVVLGRTHVIVDISSCRVSRRVVEVDDARAKCRRVRFAPTWQSKLEL